MLKTLIYYSTIYPRLWLKREDDAHFLASHDFNVVCQSIKPGDVVILVEGRSWYSRLIRFFTCSRWAHCALFIGPFNNTGTQSNRVSDTLDRSTLLLIEANLGEGVVIKPLAKYTYHNIQIGKPRGLSVSDREKVVASAISRIGNDYDLNLIFHLAVLLTFQKLLPSPTKKYLNGLSTSTGRVICRSLFWRALCAVRFPVPANSNKDFGC